MFNKTSILLIDDDAIMHDLVKSRLEKQDGYNVLSAEDGFCGLKLAVKRTPDLILLDWMMPGMSGMEVLKGLKKKSKTAKIPVFMLTGKGIMEDVETAFKAGANGYISKPIRPSDLSDRVKKALEELTAGKRLNH